MRLSKNKILITGATAGIGRELALKFLELDNQIIAVGRDSKKLEELSSTNNRIIPYKCDLAHQTELDRLAVFIEQEHPDTNILMNNAGIQYNYNFSDEIHLLARIEHEINVNLVAPVKLIALLLPVLQLNDNAAIVNVSSGLGLVPKMQAPVYCGTKAGIHIFSKALRYQLEKVKVFEVIPPLTDTGMTEGRGKNKISPRELVNEFVVAFENGQYEVSIGKVKWLKLLNRISPSIAEKILKNGK